MIIEELGYGCTGITAAIDCNNLGVCVWSKPFPSIQSITQPEQFNFFLVFVGNSGCSSWKQGAKEEIFRSDDRGATYVCKLIN